MKKIINLKETDLDIYTLYWDRKDQYLAVEKEEGKRISLLMYNAGSPFLVDENENVLGIPIRYDSITNMYEMVNTIKVECKVKDLESTIISV